MISWACILWLNSRNIFQMMLNFSCACKKILSILKTFVKSIYIMINLSKNWIHWIFVKKLLIFKLFLLKYYQIFYSTTIDKLISRKFCLWQFPLRGKITDFFWHVKQISFQCSNVPNQSGRQVPLRFEGSNFKIHKISEIDLPWGYATMVAQVLEQAPQSMKHAKSNDVFSSFFLLFCIKANCFFRYSYITKWIIVSLIPQYEAVTPFQKPRIP